MKLAFLLGILSTSIFISGCASLAMPLEQDKAFIVVSIGTEGLFLNNDPDIVVIVRQEDNSEYSFTQRTGPYYYFLNVPTGSYQLKNAVILSEGTKVSSTNNAGSAAITSSVSISSGNAISFTPEHLARTEVDALAGHFTYMGTINAEATVKLWPPGTIEFSNITVENTPEEKGKAFQYFEEKFKEAKLTRTID